MDRTVLSPSTLKERESGLGVLGGGARLETIVHNNVLYDTRFGSLRDLAGAVYALLLRHIHRARDIPYIPTSNVRSQQRWGQWLHFNWLLCPFAGNKNALLLCTVSTVILRGRKQKACARRAATDMALTPAD